MRDSRVSAPASGPRPGPGPCLVRDPDDGDDGIHIVSVTPFEGPTGASLRVVVSWHEAGAWTERTVELPAVGGPASAGSGEGSREWRPSPPEGEAKAADA